jgi:hypothetical protein
MMFDQLKLFVVLVGVLFWCFVDLALLNVVLVQLLSQALGLFLLTFSALLLFAQSHNGRELIGVQEHLLTFLLFFDVLVDFGMSFN